MYTVVNREEFIVDSETTEAEGTTTRYIADITAIIIFVLIVILPSPSPRIHFLLGCLTGIVCVTFALSVLLQNVYGQAQRLDTRWLIVFIWFATTANQFSRAAS